MKPTARKRLLVTSAIGAATLATLIFGAIQPASATTTQSTKQVVVGLGDSYTSGDGAPPFAPGTDTATDTCHRSLVAYPLVAGLLEKGYGRNVACSGAETDDLFRTFRTEAPQVNCIGNATDIVLTIGGNDVDAISGISSPPTPDEFAVKLAALYPKLVSTYQRIHAAAPNARIHAVSYPLIFPAGPVPNCPLDQATRTLLLGAETGLNQTVQAAAATAGVHYIDASSAFAGHEICTAHPWVNGIDTQNPEYSFHPNQKGQAVLGLKVSQAL